MLLILGSSVLSAEPLWQQDVPVRESKDLRFNGCSVQDNGGSVFLGWIQTTNGEPCIMGQRFDAEGSEIWPQALVIKAESKEKSDPKVALSADGCYLLAWLEEYENGISKFFMQKLTMAGGLLWGYSGLVDGKPGNRNCRLSVAAKQRRRCLSNSETGWQPQTICFKIGFKW